MKKLIIILLVLLSVIGYSQQQNAKYVVVATETTLYGSGGVSAGTIVNNTETNMVWLITAYASPTKSLFTTDDKIPFFTTINLNPDTVYSVPFVFEKELADAEVNVTVGFQIRTASVVFLNGGIIKGSQWSGIGTETLTLILDTKQYDNFLIRQ